MPALIGSCSWNYDSWIGLVYSRASPAAAGYLPEYSSRYRSVEIDSWFYRMPPPREVEDYAAAVDPDFVFTCKAPRDLTLTHTRTKTPEPNSAFLSPELFGIFLDRIRPLAGRIGIIMLEFEYLSRQKISGQTAFMDALGRFAGAIPRTIPVGIECRNGTWLNADWFAFLKECGLSMVFSEKLYLPRVADLYRRFGGDLVGPVAIRLLGDDRSAIETTTRGVWNRIVDPKPQLPDIAAMINDLSGRGYQVYANINNHFEGSAPLTMGRLESLLEEFR